jgi:hypothetical protein
VLVYNPFISNLRKFLLDQKFAVIGLGKCDCTRRRLSAKCFFSILALKSGSHPVDLVLGDVVPCALIAPIRERFCRLARPFHEVLSRAVSNEKVIRM